VSDACRTFRRPWHIHPSIHTLAGENSSNANRLANGTSQADIDAANKKKGGGGHPSIHPSHPIHPSIHTLAGKNSSSANRLANGTSQADIDATNKKKSEGGHPSIHPSIPSIHPSIHPLCLWICSGSGKASFSRL